MRVTLANNEVCTVMFKNISEPIAHDGLRSFNATEFNDLAKKLQRLRKDPELGRFLRLKLPIKRISVITTLCEIKLGENTLASGRAFYSKSEWDAGVKFNRPKAWRMALGRAVSELDILDRKTILREFGEFIDRRAKQVAQSRGQVQPAVGAPSSPPTSHLSAAQQNPF